MGINNKCCCCSLTNFSQIPQLSLRSAATFEQAQTQNSYLIIVLSISADKRAHFEVVAYGLRWLHVRVLALKYSATMFIVWAHLGPKNKDNLCSIWMFAQNFCWIVLVVWKQWELPARVGKIRIIQIIWRKPKWRCCICVCQPWQHSLLVSVVLSARLSQPNICIC